MIMTDSSLSGLFKPHPRPLSCSTQLGGLAILTLLLSPQGLAKQICKRLCNAVPQADDVRSESSGTTAVSASRAQFPKCRVFLRDRRVHRYCQGVIRHMSLLRDNFDYLRLKHHLDALTHRMRVQSLGSVISDPVFEIAAI